jgi:class 3 adenylate cyclase
VGRDPAAVVDASLEAIAVLDGALPLPARAGIAQGPVVRRAGDYFGPVVNLAQRLTTIAAPGAVVVAEPAASAVGGARAIARRDVSVRGFEVPITVAEIRSDATGA